MESWSDQGIVLNARLHGEGGAIVSMLTENHGRHAGFVHGAASAKKRAAIEPGSLVTVEWRARTSGNLGHFTLEAEQTIAPDIFQDSLKLSALQSACALCDAGLPEREGHPGLFHGFITLMDMLTGEHWGAAYVMWEIQLLRELGFRLELNKCAANGDPQTLTYVSPKSGRGVSAERAEPYKDRLLPLPEFLKPDAMKGEGAGEQPDILTGLKMTGYFLEHWAFAHHTQGVPAARQFFMTRFSNMVSGAISCGA